ncbi:aminotransferase class I/II-fold pyridoxal phosphate-dependent enzyme [Dactylosporangium salmoneum]|uniref:Aminotransferase n=1 Tax=Dactylosporangium salmoneum TaxID=53361 RepID=A0ABN3FXZ3_9ACTN
MRPGIFRQEEFFEQYEFHCRYMLALSGVQPLSSTELAGLVPEGPPDVELGYTASAGQPRLRELVAAGYPGAGAENVMVTVGAIEALLIAVNLLVGPGDEAVCLWPSYQPLHELVTAAGGEVRFVRLAPADGFAIDLDRVRAAVTARTRLVVLNVPHNPTGRDVPAADLVALADDLARRGVHLLVDEVFRRMWAGARATAWSGPRNLLVVDGLSKAFGLPGLRIGWLVGPPELVVRARQYRKYTTLNPGALDQAWACVALRHAETILARSHGLVRAGLDLALPWFAARPEHFELTAPAGGGLLFPRLRHGGPVHEFCVRLVDETGVLLAPGSDCYDMEGFLRVGFATPQLAEGLDRLDAFLRRS